VAKSSVLWTATAERDLWQILDYIDGESPATARAISWKIAHAARALATFPSRGRIVPELKRQGIFIYRELIIAPWRLMYRTTEKGPIVLAVLDSRRSVEDLLLGRLV
jgi:plasmid stabilization system protein ParE